LIRNFWRNRVLEKEMGKRLSSKKLDSSFKIRKVAIIVDPKTEIESRFFLDLAKDFKILEVQIDLMLLNKDLKLGTQYQHFFDKDEVNFWSSFKGDLLNFCEGDYDLLINYYNKANSIYSLISTRTNHKLSVGFMGADPRVNDLIFDFDPKDKQTFKNELLKYMKILNKI